MTSLGGSVKAALEAASVAVGGIYRNKAPEGAALPYIVFFDWIADVPGLQGDASILARVRSLQVSLFVDGSTDTEALRRSVRDALSGATLSDADEHVFRCQVIGVSALPEIKTGIDQYAFDLLITHVPSS